MKRNHSVKFNILLILIIIVLPIVFLAIDSKNIINKNSKQPKAVNGVLDLRNWDFKKDGIINLDGQWELYWSKLLTPSDFNSSPSKTGLVNIPGSFSEFNNHGTQLPGQGYATFRLKVLTNKNVSVYGVKTEFLQNAYTLWASDQFISSTGTVGKSKKETVPQLLPKIGAFYNNSGEFYIVLQNSNYYSSAGQIDSIYLGTESQISSLKARSLAFDFFLFGCAVIGGVYNLGLYIKRKKEKSTLYFGIVCILLGFRTLLVGERFFIYLFPHFNFSLYLILLYITFYIYVPFLVLFLNELCPNLLPIEFVNFSSIMGGIYVVNVLLYKSTWYSTMIFPYEIISIILMLYILFKLIVEFIKGKNDYFMVIIGVLAVFLTGVNDFLYEYSIIITGSYATVGLLIFIIVQSIVLSGKVSEAFTKAEGVTNRLKSINKLKDDFLAHTSHELKTPLNGIIGLTEGLISGFSGDLNKEQVMNLDLISSSAKRLSNLVNDILDFSKLKNNDIQLNLRPINIVKISNMVLRICSTLTLGKNLTLINNISDDIPLVYADENRLQQIFYNLIGNSIKFTNSGSIELSAVKEGAFVRIFIRDTGIGIPDDKLSRIFEPYNQGDEDISKRYGGTGLGLSITKKLIDLHGGSIEVISEFGRGSVFSFTLPIYDDEIEYPGFRTFHEVINNYSEDNNIVNTDNSQSSENKIRILVVDDEPVNIKVLGSFLLAENYEVLSASNGKDALAMIRENRDLDLVILDLMLPDMLGYEISSIVRDEFSIFELPILMLTADNRPESLAISFECGINDYLIKPFDKVELLCRVRTLITLRSSVKSAVSLQQKIDDTQKTVDNLNESVEENKQKLIEMLEYDKIKTEFFANISHELRTPLNVIWSTIQLLQSIDTGKTLGDKNIKNYMGIMDQNCLRLLRLINNLIDTTRIDGGYLSLELKNADIVYVVEEISLSVAEYIKAQGITLIFDTEIEEKVMAFDPDKMERVILNILSNAVKFTDKNGTIEINIYDLDDKIQISIKDTGCGIPQDKLEQIFERFAQVDKSTTRLSEGSGIGLSLVKSLIEMHGGTICAKSILGQGSEFLIELPAVLNPDIEEINYDMMFDTSYEKYIDRINVEFSDIYMEKTP